MWELNNFGCGVPSFCSRLEKHLKPIFSQPAFISGQLIVLVTGQPKIALHMNFETHGQSKVTPLISEVRN